jgi:hypothetical protein
MVRPDHRSAEQPPSPGQCLIPCIPHSPVKDRRVETQGVRAPRFYLKNNGITPVDCQTGGRKPILAFFVIASHPNRVASRHGPAIKKQAAHQ